MWSCRKLIIVRLTVCGSRSGPAGRPPRHGASRRCRALAPPQDPQGARHTRESRRDHLSATSVGTGELEPPGVEAGHRHVSIHSDRGGGPDNLACGRRGGGVTHRNSPGSPCDACTFPNSFSKKFYLKNLSRHICQKQTFLLKLWLLNPSGEERTNRVQGSKRQCVCPYL